MTKLTVTFHNFENAPKNTKPFVLVFTGTILVFTGIMLVFTGLMLVFLAASCQGDKMAEGDTEDSVWTERRLIVLPSSASPYTP